MLIFVLKGEVSAITPHHTYPLETAGILVVNPYEMFRVEAEDSAVLLLTLPQTLLLETGWDFHARCRCAELTGAGGKLSDPLRRNMAELFSLYCEKDGAVTDAVHGTALRLLGHLQRHFVGADPNKPTGLETYTERLRHVLSYIHDHWNEELRLAAIAEREYLSASYLSRLFKRYLGVSFSSYLSSLRLRHAQSLLRRIRVRSVSGAFSTPAMRTTVCSARFNHRCGAHSARSVLTMCAFTVSSTTICTSTGKTNRANGAATSHTWICSSTFSSHWECTPT